MPKDSTQQHRSLSRYFEEFFQSSGFPTKEAAIPAFLRKLPAEKIRWLKVNGRDPETGTVLKKIQCGDRLRVAYKKLRAREEFVDTIRQLKVLDNVALVDRRGFRKTVREIARLDPNSPIGRRRITEIRDETTLRYYATMTCLGLDPFGSVGGMFRRAK